MQIRKSLRIITALGAVLCASIVPRTFNLRALAAERTNAISVTETGAKGDGKSDDLTAFNEAIERADPASGGPGVIFVPPSNRPYLLSTAINIRTGETIEAQPGTAVLTALTPCPANSKGALLLTAKNVSNIKVKGLVFDGCADNIGNSHSVILVYQSDHVVFEDTEVRNARGIAIEFSGGTRGIKFSGVRHCKFENNGKYYLKSGDKKSDRRQSVAFCISPVDSAGEFANQHNFAENCEFGHNGFDNLSIGQQSYFTAANNRFGGTNNGGNIYCSHCRHVRILKNTLRDASGNGIDCFVNEDLTIVGNTSEHNGAAGIMIGDTHCALIAENKTIANYQSVRADWANDHPGVHGSSHRGGITIGGEKGDGMPGAERSSATAPGGSGEILITNNLSGDNQEKSQRTQAYGIQVRSTASVNGLLLTSDNRLFGNTKSAYGEKISGPTAEANATLPCKLWSGEN
jgi:hypothetical protein